jgi:hypothetical protein
MLGPLLACGCASSINTGPATGEKVVLKVKLQRWHELSAELKNVSTSSVMLPASNLPWEWRYSLWVKAFEDDASGSPLDERLPLADPPINEQRVTLQPDKSLQGSIDLRNRFPDLQEVLRRRDVVIFWSYVPELGDSKAHARIFGSFVIPKFR